MSLIDALPAMAEFVPERALMVLCFHEGRARMISDWPLALGPDDRESITSQLAATEADSAVLVAVGGTAQERAAALAAGSDLVVDCTVAVSAAIELESFTPGTTWTRTRDGETGQVGEVRSSKLAVAKALSGSPFWGTQTERDQYLSPAAGGLDAIAVPADRPAAEGIRLLVDTIADFHAGDPIADHTLAAVAGWLHRDEVRDTAIAFTETSQNRSAEGLWALLCRRTTGPARRDAAVLFAAAHISAGSRAGTDMGLTSARRSGPLSHFGELLADAHNLAVPPAFVIPWAAAGRRAARRNAVALPD